MNIVFIISLKRNSFSTSIVNTIQYTSPKINVFPLFLVIITLSYTVDRSAESYKRFFHFRLSLK